MKIQKKISNVYLFCVFFLGLSFAIILCMLILPMTQLQAQ